MCRGLGVPWLAGRVLKVGKVIMVSVWMIMLIWACDCRGLG